MTVTPQQLRVSTVEKEVIMQLSAPTHTTISKEASILKVAKAEKVVVVAVTLAEKDTVAEAVALTRLIYHKSLPRWSTTLDK